MCVRACRERERERELPRCVLRMDLWIYARVDGEIIILHIVFMVFMVLY